MQMGRQKDRVLPSRTLKPTLDQSMVLTGGGGKAAMMITRFWLDYGTRRKVNGRTEAEAELDDQI